MPAMNQEFGEKIARGNRCSSIRLRCRAGVPGVTRYPEEDVLAITSEAVIEPSLDVVEHQGKDQHQLNRSYVVVLPFHGVASSSDLIPHLTPLYMR